MHLLIPFAACSDPASRLRLGELRLPHLEQLVQRLTALPLEQGHEDSPSLAHERVLAQALGLPATGAIPWAARQAASSARDSSSGKSSACGSSRVTWACPISQ